MPDKQQQLRQQQQPAVNGVRKFVTEEAVRRNVPLWIGVNGPSGCGKTKSMMRMGAGALKATGGDLYVIDTENDRALHYADWFEQTYGFRFKRVRFEPPFGSLDYLAAFKQCVDQGAKVIIADSMSHEHDGIGGLLEQHESEIDRMQDEQQRKNRPVSSRDELGQAAWKLPKSSRRRMINEAMQLKAMFFFGFRAKDKNKMGGGKMKHMGMMPVSGDDLVFEMTVNMMLPASSRGIPNWNPKEEGERLVVKKGPFEELFARPRQCDEEIGQAMAKWALGSAPPKPSEAAQHGSAQERGEIIKALGLLRQKLQWDTDKSKTWRIEMFGEPDVQKLSVQQLEDARTLLEQLLVGQDEHDAELATLIELGRIKAAGTVAP